MLKVEFSNPSWKDDVLFMRKTFVWPSLEELTSDVTVPVTSDHSQYLAQDMVEKISLRYFGVCARSILLYRKGTSSYPAVLIDKSTETNTCKKWWILSKKYTYRKAMKSVSDSWFFVDRSKHRTKCRILLNSKFVNINTKAQLHLLMATLFRALLKATAARAKIDTDSNEYTAEFEKILKILAKNIGLPPGSFSNHAISMYDELGKERKPLKQVKIEVNNFATTSQVENGDLNSPRSQAVELPVFEGIENVLTNSLAKGVLNVKKETKQTPTWTSPMTYQNIETRYVPLSVGILKRAIQFPSELMIIWIKSLDADLVSAINLNPANCVLCLQNFEMFRLPEQKRKLLERGQIVMFTLLIPNSTTSIWTAIKFGEQDCLNGLRNKLFKNFQDVERVFSDFAESKGKTIINMFRCSKNEVFPSQHFTNKTMSFNFME